LGEKTSAQKALEDFLRRQSWEQGNMDYLGKDSFSNIWAKINETLGNTPEVKIESSTVKTPSPPEIVYTEEPKPLKSALKKTSTTIPPVESELVDTSELPVKQLEKLDLSKDILKQIKTPDTPTVTSPTPPTTPATQSQESVKPESVESVKETPKPEAVILKDETPTSDVEKEESINSADLKTNILTETITETVKPIPMPKGSTDESISSTKFEENLVESESSEPKLDKPLQEVSQPTPETLESQTSADNSTPLVSNDPPVAPKRAHKGSPSVPKTEQPEK